MNKTRVVQINEMEFTLQHPGIRAASDMTDNAKTVNANGVIITSTTLLADAFLEHVVVQPKMSVSDFDEIENGTSLLQNLLDEVNLFLNDKPSKRKPDQGESKEALSNVGASSED